MSKPNYYDFSQPEVLEVIIQNKQNEISQLNSNVSALQSLLASGMEILNSTQRLYEKIQKDCISIIGKLVTDRDNLKDPTKEQLDRINSEIAFYRKLKIEVTDDINQLELQRHEREEKGEIQDLKDNIVKLESELNNLQEMKKPASHYKGTQHLQF